MHLFQITIFIFVFSLGCLTSTRSVRALDIGTTATFHKQRFEAWGTSLAWMGNELGGSSNTFRRNQIMDLLFDQNNGLGLNFVRYNIGAGQNPNGPAITRPGADMDGWVVDAPSDVSDPSTWNWDWDADATQRWVLDAAIERGVTQVEAFANSAPWWMTVAQSSRGNPNTGETNLHVDNYDIFGQYLLEVTEHFESQLGIHFETLAPMNEPGATWWNGDNNQEGMHIPVGSAQSALVREIGQQILDRGLDVGLVGPEETAIRWTVNSYDNWGALTRSYISQINTHSYPWGGGSDAADAAALVAYNNSRPEGPKKIYATEFGVGGNSTPVSGGIMLANQITSDLNHLGAAGWTYWQAVEDNNGSNWGLLIAPFNGSNNWFNMRRQYYTMQQFSSYIRPSSQILHQSNEEVVAAYDPRTGTTTLVVTNDETTADQLDFDLLDQTAQYTRVIRTSDTENFKSLGPASVAGSQISLSAPGNTISTIVVYSRPNLIKNADFSIAGVPNGSSTIEGWQAEDGGFYNIFNHSATSSGSGALWTNNQSNSGKVYQVGIGDAEADLTGVAFEFSLDVKFQNEGSNHYDADIYLALEFYGADDQTLAHAYLDDYQTLIVPALGIDETVSIDSDYRTFRTGRFVAPAGTRYVRPVIRYENVDSSSNNWVFFDNAYLQETHPVADSREWTAEGSGDWSDNENWMNHALVENNVWAYFGTVITQASSVTIDGSIYAQGLTFFSEHEYQLQGAGQLITGHPTEDSVIDVRLGNHRISVTTSLVGDTEVRVLPGASLILDAGVDLNGHELTKLGGGLLDLSAGFEMGNGLITSYTTVDALISFGSNAALDGDFQLLPAPGETLELGDLFELVSYSSFSDTFDNLILPSLDSSLAWEIDYGASSLVIEIVSAAIPGDFDGDGDVDGADFIFWQRSGQSAAELAEWQNNYWANSEGSIVTIVPEPSSVAMLLGLSACLAAKTGRRLSVASQVL